MKIIVGLGNPGDKYKKTRHNVGFMMLDKIVEEKGLVWKMDKKFNAFIARDGDTIFLKPQTFMNNSGVSVQAILSYYKLLPKKLGLIKQKDSDLSDILTVIHDDLDIEFTKVKNGVNRGPAGHNGIKSIIGHLKTKNFARVRIGINGDRSEQMPVEKYVLGRFGGDELNILNTNILSNIKL